MRVLFAARPEAWQAWAPALREACPEMDLDRGGEPASFDAIIYAPGGEIEDLSPYGNARLVQSLWAGVERIVTNPTLTQPLARMVDPGLARGMAEFCTGWAMRALEPAAFWLVLGVTFAAIATYAAYRMTQRATLPAEATESYLAVLPTTSAVAVEAAAEWAAENAEAQSEAEDKRKDEAG